VNDDTIVTDARLARLPAMISDAEALGREGRLDEACGVLVAATMRFPDDPEPWHQLALLSSAMEHWPEAEACWRRILVLDPELWWAHRGLGATLRMSGQWEDASAVLLAATRRFPHEADIWDELARIAEHWGQAEAYWRRSLELEDAPASAWSALAKALRERKRWDDAEAILTAAQIRFPDEMRAFVEYGEIAVSRGHWEEAFRRWEVVRSRFPEDPAGYVCGGVALRELKRFDEADLLLAEAIFRFPANPGAAIEFAGIAMVRRDWPQALRRWEAARQTVPDRQEGYTGAARALLRLDRGADAASLLREAIARLPNGVHPHIEFGRLAETEGDLGEAMRIWHDLNTRFPDEPEGPLGEARVLSRQDQSVRADQVIEAAMARLPDELSLAVRYAENAASRDDWSLALNRLAAADQRFPESPVIRQRLFEIPLRVADAGGTVTQSAGAANSDSDRDLVMNFESLGGGGHGCEFGIFQRSVGAEPLGLLRWADIYQDKLATALDDEFAGVGEPEFTEVFIHAPDGRRQYWTTDARYHMAMNSFVNEADATIDQMSRSLLRRMRFLRTKLIADLREASEIFVYKNMKRNLTPEELDRLHQAVRRYGDNTLFYISYEDATYRNGSVEWRGPGLMVGYIDHFSHTPDTDRLIGPSHAQLLALCRRAFALWSRG